MSANPFAAPSTLPYALPPFDLITEEHFAPAFEAGLAEHLLEIEAIASNPEAATFENTLGALESSGRLLSRVSNVFFNVTSSATTPVLDDLEAAIAPRLSAHSDAIHLDPRLFARLRAVEANAGLGAGDPLDPEQTWLLQRYLLDFRRAGAELADSAQARLREINAELSSLTTAFKAHLTAETNALAVHVRERSRLAGLSEDAIAGAEQAARERGLPEGYLITLVLPSGQPALAHLEDRSLRQELHEASTRRGARGGEHDTRATLTRTVALRAERAALLGFATHAAYAVADQTAGTAEAVNDMLRRLAGPAAANALAEAKDLAAAVKASGPHADQRLQPWDWAYYAELVRRERYEIDEATLRPYLLLENVVHQGIFRAAQELYGLRFEARPDLPVYHPEVETYEVFDASGVGIGLFLADWFARDSKRGGAWMSTFVDQSHLLGERPVATINLNIPKPAPGEPALLSFDEVETAFHEFGHVLHGLFSEVTYPRFSGTNVPRDFVEFPSQVNEMWAWDPGILAGYAVHHASGEAMPAEYIERLIAARAYGEGFATTEYLAATVLDWQWHCQSPEAPATEPDQVEAFEHATLAAWGLDVELDGVRLIPARYRSSYFAHIFSGGYDAGYYSYIWSEVLDADLVDWFSSYPGPRREAGELFRRELLARGGAVDPLSAFAAVRGRQPDVAPLLRRRGLVVLD